MPSFQCCHSPAVAAASAVAIAAAGNQRRMCNILQRHHRIPMNAWDLCHLMAVLANKTLFSYNPTRTVNDSEEWTCLNL